MSDAAGNIDGMTLGECLVAMCDSGLNEAYRGGYRSGYVKLPFNARGTISYRRGYMQGVEARWRGAHDSGWTPGGDAA